MAYYADIQGEQKKSSEKQGTSFPGVVNADMNAAAAQTHMDKFHASQGHGYAAEQANHLYDILTGKDAAIVGGNNAKNGPDRLVNGINLQTKYCQSAASSVAAAFEKGQYRYFNPDGSPMQLEVPLDQYEKAVELMAWRIEHGQIPGVTNPSEARSLVRRGHFTYNQAKNVAKFGTVESLTFDAATGAILSTSALGITAVLSFAQSLWNGDDLSIAVESAAYSGLLVGGASFANSVITAQLMRTGLSKAMMVPTQEVVKLLGPKTSAAIANALRSGANISGAAAMNHVSKLLRGNIITSAVMTLVLSAKDIGNAFRGRISGKQLFKNIATIAGGIAGGAAGVVVGNLALNLIAPGAGIVGLIVSVAGAAAGGTAGGAATNSVIGTFIEDDAVELVKILEESFCRLAQDYMLMSDELDITLDDLSRALEGETLLEMFASPDHQAFADKLVRDVIERRIQFRCRIYLPAEAEFVQGIGRLWEDAEHGTGIFSPERRIQQTDPVEIGQQLTGEVLPEHSAKMAWYATKQMNLAQAQAEGRLKKMAADEKIFAQKMDEIKQEREDLKRQLAELSGGTLK